MARDGSPAFRSRAGGWVVLVAATAAAPASRPAPPGGDWRPWVEQLAAPDPDARDAAEHHLASIGTAAVPALTAAVDDPRPEVAGRGRRALRRVRLFALRGQPDAALALADRYLADRYLADRYLAADTPAARSALVAALADVRPTPVDVLVRLALLEPDAGLRSQLMAAVGDDYRPAVARLIVEGDLDAIPPLLEGAAADRSYLGAADLAVDARLTGRWDDAVARWRAERANGDAEHQALSAGILCDLYRVGGHAGDAAAAVDMARSTHDPRLLLMATVDAGDWPAAAVAAGDCWPGPASAPVRAGLLSLAGRPAEAVDAAASPGLSPGRLLLLGQVDAGLAALSADPAAGGDPVAAVAVLRARGDDEAALALARRFAHEPRVGPALSDDAADLAHQFGEGPPASADAAAEVAPATSADAATWARAVADLSAKRYAAVAADLADDGGSPDRTAWRYVRGFALDAAGDPAGRPLMVSAAREPLADVARRGALADRLAEAGLAVDAAAQRALAVRAGDPFLASVALLDVAAAQEVAAATAGDWPVAAAAAERVYLLSLWPGVTFNDAAAYVTIPADLHRARARLARSRGDWPAAAAEVAAARRLVPFGIDLPLEWVPALDGHGDAAAADALFAAAYDAAGARSARHPRSGVLHNQAAWLAACCCRHLDAAVAHAQAAVRLDPGDWQFLDTLAECRFRQGDRPAATAAERQAAALPGADAAYIARQLARFQRSPVPSTTQPVEPPT